MVVVKIKIILILFFNSFLFGSEIFVNGAWYPEINASDLISGAGSNLPSSISSSSSQTSISIDAKSPRYWYVYTGMLTSNWHANFDLQIRRTGNGGNSFVTLGDDYRSLDGYYRFFFYGRYDTNNIYCQYKLDGTSIAVPPGSYSTTVYFYVLDD